MIIRNSAIQSEASLCTLGPPCCISRKVLRLAPNAVSLPSPCHYLNEAKEDTCCKVYASMTEGDKS